LKSFLKDRQIMYKKKQKEILYKINKILEPVIEDLGYELLDIEYIMERGRWVLRIYIDKEGGVSLNDCVLVTKEVSPILDVEDPIENSYVLEVSSPGLNRPLTKEKHFLWAKGKKVHIRTYELIEGRRNFKGLLEDYKDGVAYVNVDGKVFALKFDDIEKANLIYEIDESLFYK